MEREAIVKAFFGEVDKVFNCVRGVFFEKLDLHDTLLCVNFCSLHLKLFAAKVTKEHGTGSDWARNELGFRIVGILPLENDDPMNGCITGKKMYDSQEIAEDVLIEAWSRYDYAPGRGPMAVYRCDDCGRFHLTSSGEMNPKLAQHLKEGKLHLQREANYWIEKLKKK